jgi:NAD(P)-dependent dehydrogenase (short-subunit alcohol dehydrogenase family)
MAERCAVVTGVSKGLGEALAAALLDRNYEVVGVGRVAAGRLYTPHFRLVHADLAEVRTLPAIMSATFAEVIARAPASVVVINNAATGAPAGTIGAIDAREVSESVAVNVVAPLVIADAFVRTFRGFAGERRLINVSSGAAVQPLPGAGVYCIGKAGLEMLTRVVAAEHGATGIDAITIRPGIIDTPMQAYMRSQPPSKLPSVDMFRAFHASGQLVPPDVTAARIVDRLVLSPVENGRIYSYAEI